ncbi:ABC transporter [Nocardiopsis aegyptia]|uniref:ABC transporter n=1 Tax=Nocardiopsis aegyptia TaxID=220378 RepID=UPI003671707F
MTSEHRPAAVLGAAGLGALLLLTGCAGAEPADSPAQEGASEGEEVPHGYVEGAEETSEPQSRLVVADTDTGDVRVLDLITEEVTELDPVADVDGITGDGRFAYLRSSDHGTTDIVDSGAWTVDHGDHSHYYRTGIAHVGALEDFAARGAVTDPALTSLVDEHGAARTLERPALEDGTIEPATAGPQGSATALPFAGRLVVAGGGSDGRVRVHAREGAEEDVLDGTCTDPAGAAVTRRGLVVGCEEGTLHVTEDDDALHAETIPYPDGGARTESFQHRPGSAVLAALSTDGQVWVLDLSEPAWTRLDVSDAVAVNAVGEDTFVLVLTADGTLRSLDPETGEQEAETGLLDEVGADPAPTIRIDTGRAYVNDAEAGVVHEIDYNDDLRVARTLDTGIAPHLMVETGR